MEDTNQPGNAAGFLQSRWMWLGRKLSGLLWPGSIWVEDSTDPCRTMKDKWSTCSCIWNQGSVRVTMAYTGVTTVWMIINVTSVVITWTSVKGRSHRLEEEPTVPCRCTAQGCERDEIDLTISLFKKIILMGKKKKSKFDLKCIKQAARTDSWLLIFTKQMFKITSKIQLCDFKMLLDKH